MSFNANINVELSADNFDDLVQKVQTLAKSYPVESVRIYSAATRELGAIGGAVNVSAQAEQAPKPRAARSPKADTSPTAGAAAPSPAPAADPAPAQEPVSEKPAQPAVDRDALEQQLRAILAPIASSGAAGKKQVNEFIVGRGFRSVKDIPADALPDLIEAAKGLK